MIYFISDTHFEHENVIKYCKRPFSDIRKMNETLISNWNSVVSDDDIIYHLGDFCLSDKNGIKKIASKLNGHKILVRGNHDRGSVSFYESVGFEVLTHAPIKLEEEKLLLSHVPVPDTRIPEGYINVHGHIHNKLLNDDYPTNLYDKDKHFNVSCDVLDFKPISLTRIKK